MNRKPDNILQNQASFKSNASTIAQRKKGLVRPAVPPYQMTKVLQAKGEYYAYGSADSIPHIHVYSGGDCHLKIVDRGSVKRYNIIQNGKRHAQADSALAAAEGNEQLVAAINNLLN